MPRLPSATLDTRHLTLETVFIGVELGGGLSGREVGQVAGWASPCSGSLQAADLFPAGALPLAATGQECPSAFASPPRPSSRATGRSAPFPAAPAEQHWRYQRA